MDKVQVSGDNEFEIDEKLEKIPEIIKCLVEANVEVKSAVPVRSLEDYYLNIT